MKATGPILQRSRGFLAALLAVTACGHESNEPGSTVQLDAAQAVTARIGSGGGRLRTTDSHGRAYVLDIPPLALRDSVDITLTPVASYEMPSGANLVAAAQFAPEGLRLAVPGRLAIVVPGGAPTARGFGYSGQGDSLHLDLLGRHGDTLFIPVRHFSGSGGATVTDVDLLTPSLPSDAAVHAYIEVATLSEQGAAAGSYDAHAIADAMIAWATDVVIPALQSAGTDQQLLDATARFGDWMMVLTCGADGCGGGSLHLWPADDWVDIASLLLPTRDQLRLEAARALKAGIDRLNARCIANHDIQAASNTIYWRNLAVAQQLDALVPGLDPASFNSHFCLAAVIESVTMPATLTAGVPAELQVKAGIRFGQDAPEHDYPLLVTVSVDNAAPAGVSGYTTDGVYHATLTPTGASPLFLGINAGLVQEGLNVVQGIERDTTYEQSYGHVAITPTAAILDAGAEAQFTATVTGLATSAVTWSATGGTLSGTSGTSTTYTAGAAAGTYAITATSVADPTQQATARIEIVGGSATGAGIVTSAAYFHLTAVVQPGPAGVACDTSRYVYTAAATDAESCSEMVSNGAAHATVQFQYAQTQTAQGFQFHFTSRGSSDAQSADHDTSVIGAAYTTFSGYFDVSAPSATFEIHGTLTNDVLTATSGGAVMLTTQTTPGPKVGLFCKGTSTLPLYCPQQSRDEGAGDKSWTNVSLALTPGRYYVDIWSLARSQLQTIASQTISSAAAADVTITLTQH